MGENCAPSAAEARPKRANGARKKNDKKRKKKNRATKKKKQRDQKEWHQWVKKDVEKKAKRVCVPRLTETDFKKNLGERC